MSESPALRRSTRAASSTNSIDKVDENEEATNVVANEPAKKAAKKKKPAAAKKEMSKASAKKSPKRTKKEDDSSVSSQEKPKKKRAKAPPHQRITERDPLPKLWDPSKASNGSYTFKIASWNVAGLRAILRNTPTALSDLVQKHDLDVLCLQETKLQESHLSDPKLKLNGGDLIEGYDCHWSCSTVKKGYAGTAVFVKKRGQDAKKGKQTSISNFFGKKNATEADTSSKTDIHDDIDAEMAKALTPVQISFEIGKEEHDAEGRIITLDFPGFSVSNVYVPNSGQKLERLEYRTEKWDKDLLEFIQEKRKERGVPVLWLGDLNVAHTNLEVWNDGAKHLPKQAGVTPQERASFQGQLDAGFVDAFRHLHPTAQGHYSYWSQRSGNREPNKGLRLDYFICSQDLFDENESVVVRDSYMIPEQDGSDHCPVVLELEIKK
jgi:exodeoxyribonuclease III